MTGCDWGGGGRCASQAAAETALRRPWGLWLRFLCPRHKRAWRALYGPLDSRPQTVNGKTGV